MTKTLETKTILVTGASSGIGEATARRLAASGHKLVLGARRTSRIDAIVQDINAAGGEALARRLDVTDLESVQAFAAAALERFARIDVLVNNAGIMPLSLISELRVQDWNDMIDVNIRGVLNGMAAVLPIMTSQKSGHIVNIASVSAYRADPTAAVYAATKYAVRAITDGFRQENTDIRATLVSPGLTRTELFDTIPSAETRTFLDGMLQASSISADAIAAAIEYAIHQPADVDVNELVVRPTRQQ